MMVADPVRELRRIRAERARRSFIYFVRLIRPEYDLQWFHELLAQRLHEHGTMGCDDRLGFALPPGHAKSEYAILYCAWLATRDPDMQITYVTYAAEFAETQLERLRKVFELDAYLDHFGHRMTPRLSRGEKKNSSSKIEFLGGAGWIKAVGFAGGITGGRCDQMVIDDPFKGPVDSGSPTVRERRWREYGSAVKTRRRPGRPLRILMLFTRWHEDDLTGRAKKIEGDDWRWVELEALRTAAVNEDAEVERLDPRGEGEPLWSAVASRELLEKERVQRPEIFACIWQGKPVPPGGYLFRSELVPRYEAIPACPGRWLQSWDLRNDGKKSAGSFAVGLLAFEPAHQPGTLYLADVVRGRWSPDETLEVFQRMQEQPRWRAATLRLVEQKADGIMLLSLLRGRYVGMIGVKPTTDKVTRARLVQPIIHSGSWVLPERAPWLADYLIEVFRFPGAATDDQVDATSQLLAHVCVKEDDDPIEQARQLAAAMTG